MAPFNQLTGMNVLSACGLGFLLALLIFIDQNIVVSLTNAPENRYPSRKSKPISISSVIYVSLSKTLKVCFHSSQFASIPLVYKISEPSFTVSVERRQSWGAERRHMISFGVRACVSDC